MSKENYITNRKKLTESLEENSVVYLYSGKAEYETGDEKYPFTPARNFYYLTGLDREKMILILHEYKDEVKEILFIQKPDPLVAKWDGPMMDKEEAAEISGITDIRYMETFEKTFSGILRGFECGTAYFDLERIEWGQRLSYNELFAEETRNLTLL